MTAKLNTPPLITVIIPVYNTAKLLAKCIDSVLSQTWQNIEVILVDDGSTDNSADIIKNYQRTNPDKVIAIFQENAGQASARNAALDIMRGDYVAFVDSDDWVLPEMFRCMLNNLIETNSEVVTCDYQIVDAKGQVLKVHSCGDVAERGQFINDDYSVVFSLEPQVTSKLFTSQLFDDKKNRFPTGIWYEDLVILPTMLSNCNRITKVSKPYYQYYKRSGTTTTTYTLKVLDGLIATDLIEQNFKLENKFEIYKKFITSLQLRILYLTCLRIALINNKNQRSIGFKKIKRYIKQHKYLLTTKDFLARETLKTKIITHLVYLTLGEVIFYIRKIRDFKSRG